MRALAFILLAGCSNILGIDDLAGPGSTTVDAAMTDGEMPMVDAMTTDGAIPAQITISGSVSVNSITEPNVMLELVDFASDVVISVTPVSPSGQYMFTVDTNGMPVRVYVRMPPDPTGRVPGTSIYPRGPLAADTQLEVRAISRNSVSDIRARCQVPNSADHALVLVTVFGPNNAPLAGARVEIEPVTSPCYAGPNGVMPGYSSTDSSGYVVFPLAIVSAQTTVQAIAGNPPMTIGPRPVRITRPDTVHIVPLANQ